MIRKKLVSFDFDPAEIGAFVSGASIQIGKSVSPSNGQVSNILLLSFVNTHLKCFQLNPDEEELKDFAGWVAGIAWSPKEDDILASWDTSFTARLWQVYNVDSTFD